MSKKQEVADLTDLLTPAPVRSVKKKRKSSKNELMEFEKKLVRQLHRVLHGQSDDIAIGDLCTNNKPSIGVFHNAIDYSLWRSGRACRSVQIYFDANDPLIATDTAQRDLNKLLQEKVLPEIGDLPAGCHVEVANVFSDRVSDDADEQSFFFQVAAEVRWELPHNVGHLANIADEIASANNAYLNNAYINALESGNYPRQEVGVYSTILFPRNPKDDTGRHLHGANLVITPNREINGVSVVLRFHTLDENFYRIYQSFDSIDRKISDVMMKHGYLESGKSVDRKRNVCCEFTICRHYSLLPLLVSVE